MHDLQHATCSIGSKHHRVKRLPATAFQRLHATPQSKPCYLHVAPARLVSNPHATDASMCCMTDASTSMNELLVTRA